MSADDPNAAAERALARLEEMSADLQAGAILDEAGAVLASTGAADWPAVGELWSVADELDGARVTQVHVATDDGEVFATRGGGLTAVALSRRHALASLMFCDLRSVLREAAA